MVGEMRDHRVDAVEDPLPPRPMLEYNSALKVVLAQHRRIAVVTRLIRIVARIREGAGWI